MRCVAGSSNCTTDGSCATRLAASTARAPEGTGMRLAPIFRDAGSGLRRNLTMTLAVILCSAVSLALLGAGLLLQRQVDITSDALFGRVELNIYLSDGVTPDQQQALAERLAADPQVKNFVFETQEQAFDRAKKLYADSPGLL